MEEIDIQIYETAAGKRPFEIWVKELKEIHTRAKILTRLDRLRLGNFGDCKSLQEGVYELTKSFCSIAEATKVPRTEISRRQRSI